MLKNLIKYYEGSNKELFVIAALFIITLIIRFTLL